MSKKLKYGEVTQLVALRIPKSLVVALRKRAKKKKNSFSEEIITLLSKVIEYI
jgi:hypothetical protein